LLNDYYQDMSRSFFIVGLTFLAAGILWILGTRHLKRDTEFAPMRRS
jgi:hypothetical protein